MNRRWLEENRDAAKYGGATEPHKITYLAIKKPKNSKEGEVGVLYRLHSNSILALCRTRCFKSMFAGAASPCPGSFHTQRTY